VIYVFVRQSNKILMRKIDLSNFRVATSETARDINRRIVLNLVRIRQPISRADLARLSGLQRSTVSLIVEQLIDEKWIAEGAVGHLPRGRRPTFLHLNSERARIVGINVRPSSTTLALADFNGRIVAQETMPTVADPKAYVDQLCSAVRRFIKSRPEVNYEGIGVSVPGRVYGPNQMVAFAPNLGWRDLDIKGPLERATALPVELENACNACALAETWFGDHESVRDLVAITVAEGVGAGIVVNGQLVRGPSELAGEFGHVPINFEGPQCGCGNRGCWEVFASNAAAVRYFLEASTRGAKRGRNGGASESIGRSQLTYDDVLQLAGRGNERAIEALEKQAFYLGIGLVMIVNGLAPSAIMLVGEVTRAWERVGPIIKKVVAERAMGNLTTKILPADEALQPRLRGTIALVLQKHFGAPTVA
jgi:predicted NBD/HSP70 family sugar kinase